VADGRRTIPVADSLNEDDLPIKIMPQVKGNQNLLTKPVEVVLLVEEKMERKCKI